MALLGAMFVPAVSALENEKSLDIKEVVLNLNSVKDSFNANNNIDEFYKENEAHYKFLVKNLGEASAKKVIEQEYNRINSVDAVKSQKSTEMVQIDNDNVYIWKWISGGTNTNDIKGPNNVIFYNRERSEIATELKNTGDWERAYGWTEYSIRGSDQNTMSWVQSAGSDAHGYAQLQDGDYFGSRYHLVLFEGYTDSNEGAWCFGNCHYEYWDTDDLNHYLYSNSCDTARNHLYSSILSNNLPLESKYNVNLNNAYPSTGASGIGYLFKME